MIVKYRWILSLFESNQNAVQSAVCKMLLILYISIKDYSNNSYLGGVDTNIIFLRMGDLNALNYFDWW